MSLIYDDRDPIIEYSAGSWGEAGNAAAEFRGTTSYSDVAGATARVPFTGRGITVYGTITVQGDRGSPVSSYAIDGSSSRVQFVGRQTDRVQYLVPFFTVNDLEYGEHVLTVTNEAGSEAVLFLDYFEVTGFNDPGPSSSPTSPPSNPTSESDSEQSSDSPSPSSPRPSSPSGSIRSTGQGTSGPTRSLATSSTLGSGLPASTLPEDSASKSSGPPMGAIVGGVLGAIAAICIAFLIFVLCKRRRRKRRDGFLANDHSPQMQSGPPQSFVAPFNTNDAGLQTHLAHGEVSAIVGGSQGRVTNAYPSTHNSTSPHHPSAYSGSVVAGDGHEASMRETAASPLPPSSRSMASGITGGGSSGYPAGTIDSHQRDMTSISSGFSGSQKLMSNVALTAPNRAVNPQLDPPPGYQA